MKTDNTTIQELAVSLGVYPSEPPAKEQDEARRSAATCSAAPDAHGFWWWQRKDAERWEMVRVMDFGDGTLTAYSCEGSWGGWSLNVSPDRFAGKWVKISPPNDQAKP